ncbi:MAG TPA: cupredoxin domain-containing protein [bacterium]|nr:cupredoxin domain-containing protein [bacterium]
MRRRSLVLGLTIVLVIGVGLTLRLAASPVRAHPREITLQASQWRYSPGIITVNQGDQVTVILKAEDVVHGFYLDGYGISRAVRPDQTAEIHFVASKPGRWMFRCSVTCGPFHPYMIGWLRVEPNTTLKFGWIVVGAVGVAALLFAWEEARKP